METWTCFITKMISFESVRWLHIKEMIYCGFRGLVLNYTKNYMLMESATVFNFSLSMKNPPTALLRRSFHPSRKENSCIITSLLITTKTHKEMKINHWLKMYCNYVEMGANEKVDFHAKADWKYCYTCLSLFKRNNFLWINSNLCSFEKALKGKVWRHRQKRRWRWYKVRFKVIYLKLLKESENERKKLSRN